MAGEKSRTEVEVDLDKLAGSLGISTNNLKSRLEFLCTLHVVREAARLGHADAQDIKHENLVDACHAILPEIEESVD